MGGGTRIFIILVLMFIGMYCYSISYKYIRAAKQKRIQKAKFIKEGTLKLEKLRLQKIREEKTKLIALRSKEIKRQFKWLEGVNKDSESKTSAT